MLLLLILSVGLVFYLRIIQSGPQFRPEFSTLMRLSYWKDTWKIIAEHPFKGVGLGNFNLVESRYAHNSFLQIWAETGILGLLSFLWFIAISIKTGLKNKKSSPENAAIIAAALVFLIHNLVDFTFFLPETVFSWWVILGLLF